MFKVGLMLALGWRFGNHVADLFKGVERITSDMYRKYKRGEDSDLLKENPLAWVQKRADEAAGVTTSKNKMKIGF